MVRFEAIDNKCCEKCFSIPEIEEFIIDEEQTGDCDYCGSKDIKICNITEVADFILEGVNRYYEDAAESGGYLLPTDDMHEILRDTEMIFSDLLDDPTDLLNDMYPPNGVEYVRKNPYGAPDGQPEEIDYWFDYCQYVKNKRRFTLFLNQVEDKHHTHRHSDFLKNLVYKFLPTQITVLQKGKTIYRGRIKKRNIEYGHKKLTSPPIGTASNNRMSSVGIPFFYGAMDTDTCIHEIRPSVAESAVVGKFKLLKRLVVLDLSMEIEDRLSIFNSNYHFEYETFFKPFLRHFISDIAKPIRSSDQDIEYLPTQILTEYISSINFKNHFLFLKNGVPKDVFLNGILFKSSLRAGGINIVLFKGQEISLKEKANGDPLWLSYEGNEEYQITGTQIKYEIVSNQE